MSHDNPQRFNRAGFLAELDQQWAERAEWIAGQDISRLLYLLALEPAEFRRRVSDQELFDLQLLVSVGINELFARLMQRELELRVHGD